MWEEQKSPPLRSLPWSPRTGLSVPLMSYYCSRTETVVPRALTSWSQALVSPTKQRPLGAPPQVCQGGEAKKEREERQRLQSQHPSQCLPKSRSSILVYEAEFSKQQPAVLSPWSIHQCDRKQLAFAATFTDFVSSTSSVILLMEIDIKYYVCPKTLVHGFPGSIIHKIKERNNPNVHDLMNG